MLTLVQRRLNGNHNIMSVNIDGDMLKYFKYLLHDKTLYKPIRGYTRISENKDYYERDLPDHIIGWIAEGKMYGFSASSAVDVSHNNVTISGKRIDLLFYDSGSGLFNINGEAIPELPMLYTSREEAILTTFTDTPLDEVSIDAFTVRSFGIKTPSLDNGIIRWKDASTSVDRVGMIMSGADITSLLVERKSDSLQAATTTPEDGVDMLSKGTNVNKVKLDKDSMYFISSDYKYLTSDADIIFDLNLKNTMITYQNVQELIPSLYNIAKNNRDISVTDLSKNISSLVTLDESLYYGFQIVDDISQDDMKAVAGSIEGARTLVNEVDHHIDEATSRIAEVQLMAGEYSTIIESIQQSYRALSSARATSDIITAKIKTYLEQFDAVGNIVARNGYNNASLKPLYSYFRVNDAMKVVCDRAALLADVKRTASKAIYFWQSCDRWVVQRASHPELVSYSGDKWVYPQSTDYEVSVTATENELLQLGLPLKAVQTAVRQTYTSCGRVTVVIDPVEQTARPIASLDTFIQAVTRYLQKLVDANQTLELLRQSVIDSEMVVRNQIAALYSRLSTIEIAVFEANNLKIAIDNLKKRKSFYLALIDLYERSAILPITLIEEKPADIACRAMTYAEAVSEIMRIRYDDIVTELDSGTISTKTLREILAKPRVYVDGEPAYTIGEDNEIRTIVDDFAIKVTRSGLKITHNIYPLPKVDGINTDDNIYGRLTFPLFPTRQPLLAHAIAYKAGAQLKTNDYWFERIRDLASRINLTQSQSITILILLLFVTASFGESYLMGVPTFIGEQSVFAGLIMRELLQKGMYAI